MLGNRLLAPILAITLVPTPRAKQTHRFPTNTRLWSVDRADPPEYVVRDQESAVAASVLGCVAPSGASHSSDPRTPIQPRITVVFGQAGSVLWTNLDGIAGSSGCVAHAARTMRIPGGRQFPVLIHFPLEGLDWTAAAGRRRFGN